MERNCNLELGLATPPPYDRRNNNYRRGTEEEQQKLTIFYNGRMAASIDATEFQARAIIDLASRGGDKEEFEGSAAQTWTTLNPLLVLPLSSTNNNNNNDNNNNNTTSSRVCVKRSLQRFLKKREDRAQSLSPYPQPSLQ
ncbi:protein TIFY 5A-like [Andrographis paniculata]|uniref:protein TIFY 5A-like n=1 Tax=Andrographis paniculata TaxID=175694 RepID=UPI0021E9379A|nr:protein TIFY 5A-like [Andrographis paniculata]